MLIKAVALIFILTSFGCGRYNLTSHQAELEKAAYLVNNHDYNEASIIYLRLATKNPFIKNKAANCLRLANNIPRAKQLYLDSLNSTEHINDYLDAQEGLSLCYLQEGNIIAAIEVIKKVINIDPKRWRSINILAISLALNNYFSPAIEYFKIALDFSNHHYSVANNLAIVLALDKKPKSAIHLLERMINNQQISTQNKQKIELNLALLYAINNELTKAELICKKYLSEKEVVRNLTFYKQLINNSQLTEKYLTKHLVK